MFTIHSEVKLTMAQMIDQSLSAHITQHSALNLAGTHKQFVELLYWFSMLGNNYCKLGPLKQCHSLFNNSVGQKFRQAQLSLCSGFQKAEVKVLTRLESYVDSAGKNMLPKSFRWLAEFISMMLSD